jgi:hypothetical protein
MNHVTKKKKNDLLLLAPLEIQEQIGFILGLKVSVIKENNKLFISLLSYQSCFRLMERLHWDFDFSVHKRNKHYVVEIWED